MERACTHAQGWPRPCRSARMMERALGTGRELVMVSVPWSLWESLGPSCPTSQSSFPLPRPCPGLGPISNGLPSMALAVPGLSVFPSAGGEGQSLQQQQQLGLWVIAGFLTFLALEKMFLDCKEQERTSQVSPKPWEWDTSASVM